MIGHPAIHAFIRETAEEINSLYNMPKHISHDRQVRKIALACHTDY